MATVRMTESIIDQVQVIVNKMRFSAQKSIEEKYSGVRTSIEYRLNDQDQLNTEFNKLISSYYWGQWEYLSKELPDAWMIGRHSFRLCVVVPDYGKKDVDVHFAQPIRMPHHLQGSYGMLRIDDVQFDVYPGDKEYLVRSCSLSKELNANARKFEEITVNLKQFLRAFSTVNAAVKSQPSITAYIPQDIITKMENKVVRTGLKAPDKETPTLNTELLVTTYVQHRMSE